MLVETGAFSVNTGSVCYASLKEVKDLDSGLITRNANLALVATDHYSSFDDGVVRRAFNVRGNRDGSDSELGQVWLADAAETEALIFNFFDKVKKVKEKD